ncbi:hypothetical protein I6F65_20950, partial [Pseudoalteromonas sp. SWXJZ94C]|uniref:RHS repeat domain-containing protein n=1 Tax=Pseudoalteromonas sp. SWXJZ94C TaxID=2792065 RepID=UPI001A250A16|nr:hypothetical protein [Pseudoalteromonas sp. SWXJZ94C]
DSTTLKYSYNQFGQLSSINLQQVNSSAIELAQLTYDNQGNIKTQQFGNNITLAQKFDVFNRLTQQQLTHPAQALFDTCTYKYDSVNQLIARKNEGVTSHNINFEYNSLGQLIQQTLANSSADTTTQYKWDSFGNPQTQTVQSSAIEGTSDTKTSNALSSEHSTVNKALNNNDIDARPSVDLTRATHNEYNDLASNSNKADIETSSFNAHNTIKNSATEADRLTQFGDSDFDYDELGNQIRETGKGIKTLREYNAFNQLSCFNNNGTLTQYDYDPLGRRIAKHTEHGKIDYIWDINQLIGECQNGQYTWYINLPNQFHPLALIKKGEMYYYHLDQLNTPRFITNSSAQVVWENQADAYGYEESKLDAESTVNNTFTQPIRFQGQYLDEESGLHYNRYRYYSPKQQRFINQDPIGLVGGINHYQYAPNPINWVDPFGLTCKDGQKKNVFAGHGSINVTKPATVPMGTSLTVYSWDGATITDDLGSKIEDGTVSSGVFKKVYTEGDIIPGYMLHPNCGSLNISSNSIQVSESKHISELLAENMGEYHWAACTYIDGHENSNIIHDEEGIFKEESGQYSQLKGGKWEGLDENASDDPKRSKKIKKIKLNALEKDQVKALLKEGVPIRAAIKHIKGQKITPRDFGTKSISENPQLNQMWNECILELTERPKAKAKKFFQSYQNLIDGTASKKEARYVFDEVNSLFKVKVNNAKEKGVIFEGYIFEQVHHWNWPIEKYSKQAISAENLFPTTAKLHAIIHNMTTSSSKKFVPFSYFHPISKLHERV